MPLFLSLGSSLDRARLVVRKTLMEAIINSRALREFIILRAVHLSVFLFKYRQACMRVPQLVLIWSVWLFARIFSESY